MRLKKLFEARNFDDYLDVIFSGPLPGSSNWYTAGKDIEKARHELKLESWDHLKGLRVVDLGCGADYIDELPEAWPPLYAFLMANLGAIVTGCEIREFRTDKFECLQADLVEVVASRQGLSSIGLGRKTINIINTSNFTGAPHDFGRDVNLNRSLREAGISSDKFEELLAEQISTILVSGGVWIQDGDLRLRK